MRIGPSAIALKRIPYLVHSEPSDLKQNVMVAIVETVVNESNTYNTMAATSGMEYVVIGHNILADLSIVVVVVVVYFQQQHTKK